MLYTDSRIYRRALELISLSKKVLAELPTGYGFLADQLRRAAASVALNFAEGCGKRSARERRRYFETARASAYEVAAVLDVAQCFGVLDEPTQLQGREVCDHLAAMLVRYR